MIEFELMSWTIAFDAQVTAASLYGTAEADTVVDFTDDVTPGPPVLLGAYSQDDIVLVQWQPNGELGISQDAGG